MRRFISTILVTALVVATFASPAAARKRRIRGSFTASGAPLPTTYLVPGGGSCRYQVEGVHKVSRIVQAPFAGWLQVEMTFATPQSRLEGWNLLLMDAQGDELAHSEYEGPSHPGIERLEYFLEEGEKVFIVACNVSSLGPAEVRYVLEEGRAWSTSSARRLVHTEELPYKSPALATSQHYVLCHVGFQLGCTATEPWPSDRLVSVEVVDAASPRVAFELYQYSGSTYLGDENFCGSTPEPVEIVPRADFIGVTLHIGPCSDGTPAMATTGTVVMELSSR